MTLTPEQRSVLKDTDGLVLLGCAGGITMKEYCDVLTTKLATARLERDAERLEVECLREAFREWNNFDSATCFQYLVGADTCPAFIAKRVRAARKETPDA